MHTLLVLAVLCMEVAFVFVWSNGKGIHHASVELIAPWIHSSCRDCATILFK